MIFDDSNEIGISRPPLSGGYLTQTVNSWTFRERSLKTQKQNHRKYISQKFSKLNLEKIARTHLSQKYWHCKVFLYLRLTTITKLNFLFVLYFWFSYCRFWKRY